MDFIDQIRTLSSRVASAKDIIQTEEATKHAMVMPFIHLLGYNVFDPLEVTPELIADVGTKKGEKVDYAILQEGKPIMLFECKKCGGDLGINHCSQLFRYFHVTAARFGVLTNGILYRFFTDLEQPNKMDEKPFFEFNILDFRERDVEELKKFAKSAFNLDNILTTANDLKYTRAIQHRLSEWMVNPSEDLVRLLANDLIGNRRFTPAVKDQFTLIVKRAFEHLLGERINERLKGAMTSEASPTVDLVASTPKAEESSEAQVFTSEEEVEGFYIIRAILRSDLSPQRIFMRDAQSYCAILLDDNNRRPICRLRFNNAQKLSLGVFNDKKEEEKFTLDSVDDIYNYAEQLRATAKSYLGQPVSAKEGIVAS